MDIYFDVDIVSISDILDFSELYFGRLLVGI